MDKFYYVLTLKTTFYTTIAMIIDANLISQNLTIKNPGRNKPNFLLLLRTRSTFRRLLCFRKVFLECQVCAHDEREMFCFVFYLFLLCCCLNPPTTNAGTRGGARTLPRTHGRSHIHTDACTHHYLH